MDKDKGSTTANSGYPKKCKELESIEAQVSEAYATFDDMGNKTTRTRSHKLKRGTKSLGKFINELVRNFKKKNEELEVLKEDVRLERREFVDTLEKTKLSYESSHEEDLRR